MAGKGAALDTGCSPSCSSRTLLEHLPCCLWHRLPTPTLPRPSPQQPPPEGTMEAEASFWPCPSTQNPGSTFDLTCFGSTWNSEQKLWFDWSLPRPRLPVSPGWGFSHSSIPCPLLPPSLPTQPVTRVTPAWFCCWEVQQHLSPCRAASPAGDTLKIANRGTPAPPTTLWQGQGPTQSRLSGVPSAHPSPRVGVPQ